MHSRLGKVLSLALVAALVAGVGGAALVGCAKKQPTSLVIGTVEEIESADVQQVNWDNFVHMMINDPLITMGPKMDKVMPSAASSVEIAPDGSSLTLKFPAEMKFADGTPITADTVKASIERYIATSPYGSDWDPMSELVVVDPHTLQIKLKEPAAYFLYAISTCYSGIVDAAKAQSMGKEAFGRAPVTYGPWVVKEWQQGSQITLVRNDNFIDNKPFVKNKGPVAIETAVVRFIPDTFTLVQELLKGNVDIVVDVPTEQLAQVQADPNITLETYIEPGTHYMYLNTHRPPFDDLRVRQAVALAINRDELKSALDNAIIPVYGTLGPAQICFSQATEDAIKAKLGFNQAKAKQLLAEAGYTDTNGDGIVEKNGKPLSVTLAVGSDRPMDKKAAPIIQQQLKAIGIDVAVNEYEYSYVRQLTRDLNFDMAIRNVKWPDPDIWYSILDSSQTDGKIWSDPRTDKLLEESRTAMDLSVRTEKFSQVADIIAEEVPFVSLYSQTEYVAIRKNVTGVILGVDGTLYFNDATKK